MKKAGIVLMVIEVLVIVFGFITGKSVFLEFATSDRAGAALIAEALGYLLPGIIGLILYRKGKKKEAAAAEASAPAYTAPHATAAASGFCPKCGARVEADDAFCTNCGAKLK